VRGEESPDTDKYRALRSFGRSRGSLSGMILRQTVQQKTNCLQRGALVKFQITSSKTQTNHNV